MPRILYEQGFSFSFFAGDGHEPPHVHVTKSGHTAKWWLDPIAEANNERFNAADRSRIRSIIRANQRRLLDSWEDFFPAQGR